MLAFLCTRRVDLEGSRKFAAVDLFDGRVTTGVLARRVCMVADDAIDLYLCFLFSEYFAD